MNEPIAIVGAACRFPGAPDTAAFWQSLREGLDAVEDMPADRWDAAEFFSADPAAPGKINTRRAGLLRQIDSFDAEFFHISPREAVQMDPQQRLALELAWEALEDAGLTVTDLGGTRTGVFMGAFPSDYARLMGNRPEHIRQHTATGHDTSAISTRISFTFDLRGPSLVVNTACSSSLVAVHLACQSLRQGECSVALAGGVHLIVTPFSSVLMTKFGALSPDGVSRAFDAGANGYVRGEGGGIVVLKKLSAALADGDPIWCVIRGSAVNNGGAGPGLAVPSQAAQEAVIREACDSAGVPTHQVQYVEAHGTGTIVGDPIEAHALATVLGPGRAPGRPLMLGSVKTNIGHLEAAAGVAGLLKVALALRHGQLPPSLHFERPNPRIDFEQLGIAVQQACSAWPAGDELAVAGVNSIGFGGTNCHVILTEAPRRVVEAQPRETSGPWIVPLSARSPGALSERAQALATFMRDAGDVSLESVAYTASVRRDHLTHRAAAVASSTKEMVERLEAIGHGDTPSLTFRGKSGGQRGGIAFVFSGQGSQWPGMARRLIETGPVFRAALAKCDAVMRPFLGWSLLEALCGSPDGSPLRHIDGLQPAIFGIQVALGDLWRTWGVVPDAVVGHSIGEVAAAHVAGILALDDAAQIICRRSRLLRRVSGQGAMASVALPVDDVRSAISPYSDCLSIAINNSPRATVVAGDPAALDLVLRELGAQGVATYRIDVDVASHSPAMDILCPDIVEVLDGIRPGHARVPFYSTVAGAPLAGPLLDPGYWADNLRQPVRFAATIERLARDGYATFVELSAHPILLSAVAECLEDREQPPVLVPSLRREQDERMVMLGSLAALYTQGYEVNWKALHARAGTPLSLPGYPWQRKRFWLDLAEDATSGTPSSAGHPLLGRRLHSALRETQFESLLRANCPAFLADHRVSGAELLPMAGFVEMACAALGQTAYVIEDLVIRQPLSLASDRPRRVQSVLRPLQDGTSGFEVFSQHQVDSDTWTLHASATLHQAEPLDAFAGAADALSAARHRCQQEIAIEALYADFESRGLAYGPAFRGLQRLWRGNGEAVGCVALTEAAASDGPDYVLHPVVLDACLQVGIAAGSAADDDAVFLPIGIERLRMCKRVADTDELWVHARLRHLGPISGTLDVLVFDAAGSVLVEVTGLQAKRAERAAPAPLDDDPDGWLYELRWEPSMVGPSAGALVPGGRWLIFADRSGTATDLVRALRAADQRCVQVNAGPTYARSGIDQLTIDPLQPQHFERLLAEIGDTERCSIAYLWALDAHSREPDAEQALVCGGLLHLVQGLVRRGAAPPSRCLLKTCGGVAAEPSSGVVALSQSTLWGMGRVITSEHPELACQCVDLDPGPLERPLSSAEVGRALFEAIRTGALDDAETQIALRGPTRLVARLVRGRIEDNPGRSPELDIPVRLETTARGGLENLVLVPRERRPPGAGEVEIRVRATGLNFRDVLEALGLNPWTAAPFGNECAGTVVSVGPDVDDLHIGDDVVALASDSFGSYCTASAKLVVRRPSGMSAEAAASVPVAFLTAFYGLDRLARLQPGQRVLIHAAAGGVGMAAVQLALRTGAEVFATASPSKWGVLRACGLQHIMSSRTLEFADAIREQTQGQGIDVALNSLGGDFIPATLGLLRPGGRFVELGKRDNWNAARVHARQPDVTYARLDLGEIARAEPGVLRNMLLEVLGGFADGSLRPLPRRVFPLDRATEAFTTMLQARHIGKIVVTHGPPERAGNSAIREDGMYLITGGLGALGLHVADWLVAHGARHLVLVGRQARAEAPTEVQAAVSRLEQAGAQVLTVVADVSRANEVERALQLAGALGPAIVGVFHAAGVLDDGVLLHQEWQRFEPVLAPKVDGAWHLHSLTRHLPLEHFVLFSSMASILGSAGQANYASANAFLDALAHQRRAQGLPGVSINWGAWGGAGMIAPVRERLDKRWSARGVGYMPPQAAVAILGRVLCAGWHAPAQLGVVSIDWTRYLEPARASAAQRLCARLTNTNVEAGRAVSVSPRIVAPQAGSALKAELLELTESQRRARLQGHVAEELAKVLGFDAQHAVDPDTSFAHLGLDSLMAVELHARLRTSLSIRFPLTAMFDAPSVAGLSSVLFNVLGPVAIPGQPAAERRPRAAQTSGDGSAVVSLQTAGSRPPFFCVAPVLGIAIPYIPLARELGRDQPFYGLQPPGVDGHQTPLSSVREMAAHYVDAVRSVQPTGPYYLGGWSFGGVVAYELARQLVAHGQTVALLAVIDVASPTSKSSVWSALQFFATVGSPGIRYFLPDYIGLRFGRSSPRRARALRALIPSASQHRQLTPALRTLGSVFLSSVHAGYAYEAETYAGRLTLLRTADRSRPFLQTDRTWGWSQLASGGV